MSKVGNAFVEFMNKSQCAFTAVKTMVNELNAAGFERISERNLWKLKPGGSYYFTRNSSSLVAFTIGSKFVPGNGFTVVAAHTDSPQLRLKPSTGIDDTCGLERVRIAPYGGGIWSTWFDRDLSITGRCVVRNENNVLEPRIFTIKKPILKIPSLAIHLTDDRMSADSGKSFKFQFNKEDQMMPIISLASGNSKNSEASFSLINILATELNCKPENIVDYDIQLFDVQESCLGGANNEFIFSGRLDNLASCWSGLQGLLSAKNSAENAFDTRMLMCFDNEEVGSDSANGAGSIMLEQTIRRVNDSLAENHSLQLVDSSIAKSFIVSADMAHAIHPNYSSKHENGHSPKMGEGTVLKVNVNQRYASNGLTGAVIRELCSSNKLALQDFVIRNDSRCGSTVGNILASGSSIKTVDVGMPQLSMHSIREMGCVKDLESYNDFFKVIFEQYAQLDEIMSKNGFDS